MSDIPGDALLQLTSIISRAYIRGNAVPVAELPSVLRSVHGTLRSLATGVDISPPLKPAVSIKRSITQEYLICLEDGGRFKMLKRYLRTHYDLTPEQYRAKWGLPLDYPMTAPSYAAQRSALAKKFGLGRGPRQAASRARKRKPDRRNPLTDAP
ncbi:MAG: MucR family transcriptional regulator [Terriglobia bacterium]|nr:MucR family transcriptional regulator [Terriglobia bacterium]